MGILKKIKLPIIPSAKKIENFFLNLGLSDLVEKSKTRDLNVNELIYKGIYKPELIDLYRLYKFVELNKRTTILEFGSGWSTLIFSLAMIQNKNKYTNQIKNLRRNDPFKIFIVENEKKYLETSKKRILKYFKKINKTSFLKKNVKFNYSECKMKVFNGKICTEYLNLPLCNPDFIYLDGPDQFNIKGKINGISTSHPDMMPMVSDLLKIEFFLTPGTIIVTDGRGANAQFLQKNFQREWLYLYDKNFDQHIFYLNAPSLGKYNDKQIKFYKQN